TWAASAAVNSTRPGGLPGGGAFSASLRPRRYASPLHARTLSKRDIDLLLSGAPRLGVTPNAGMHFPPAGLRRLDLCLSLPSAPSYSRHRGCCNRGDSGI